MILTTNKIQEIEDQHTSGLYAKRPIAIVRGQGAHTRNGEKPGELAQHAALLPGNEAGIHGRRSRSEGEAP